MHSNNIILKVSKDILGNISIATHLAKPRDILHVEVLANEELGILLSEELEQYLHCFLDTKTISYINYSIQKMVYKIKNKFNVDYDLEINL